PDATFDRVLANFALLHLPDPERACAEAFRVLKPGGKFGFTVWAPPEENPYAKMIDDAIQAHADLEIDLPTGPPHYLFSGREEFRRVLERVGFNGAYMRNRRLLRKTRRCRRDYTVRSRSIRTRVR